MGLETITGTLQEQKAKIQKVLVKMQEAVAQADSRMASEEKFIKGTQAARHETVQTLTVLSAKERDRADREIDGFDTLLRSSERLIESIKLEREPLVAEIEKLRVRLREIDEQLDLQARALAVDAWGVEVEQAARKASEDMDAARVSLGRLFKLTRKGQIEFDQPLTLAASARNILNRVLPEFFDRQNSVGTRGFERVLGVDGNHVEFKVWPAIRKEDLP